MMILLIKTHLCPTKMIDKEAFKGSIKEMSRDFNKEQNYEEAVKEAYKVFTTRGLPSEVQFYLFIRFHEL